MATQQKTSYMANALVSYAHQWISTLPGWEQAYIPMDKIPAAAGALAKFVLDTSDQYDTNHPPVPPAPQPAPTLEAPVSGWPVKGRRSKK